MTTIPGIAFSGGLDDHLRADDAASGRIIWDVYTKRNDKTVTRPRPMAAPSMGPVVIGGMLYVTSGNAHLGGHPATSSSPFRSAAKSDFPLTAPAVL